MIKRKSKYTKELLEPLVKSAYSVRTLLDALGLQPTGGNYRNINAKLKEHNIDTSHFTGQAWNKGMTADTNEMVKQITQKLTFSTEDVFCENSPVIGGVKLRKRLLALGWEYKCAICNLSEWLNKPITLHVDHINGNHIDNRFENLRFLCPNCHQQTETWGNKK